MRMIIVRMTPDLILSRMTKYKSDGFKNEATFLSFENLSQLLLVLLPIKRSNCIVSMGGGLRGREVVSTL